MAEYKYVTYRYDGMDVGERNYSTSGRRSKNKIVLGSMNAHNNTILISAGASVVK